MTEHNNDPVAASAEQALGEEAAKKRGAGDEAGFKRTEFGVPIPPGVDPKVLGTIIPWRIYKYDRATPSSIIELRTAHHKGVVLVVVIRADGTGTTIAGMPETTANEVRWDDITQGVDYIEEKFK